MKQKILLLLTALCFGFVSGVKADVVVPNPVYFNDFSSSEGLTQVGSGEFIDDVDPRFGQIYHNNPENSTTPRTNYLKLPSDVLTHSGTTQEMTVGFWVNCKSTTEYFFCPLFSAYSTTKQGVDNGWPMFMCQSRCLLQINAGDGYWSDFVDAQNDKGTNNATTVWLDDNKWHYYTVTLTSTKAIVYVDGVVQNSWTLDGTSVGQNISGFFTKAASGTYPEVCLGGNQAWGWGDKDPSYGFDDFAVYDAALTAEQIAQIISNKKESAEIIGETDCSTYYLDEMSEKIKLVPGQSWHFRFTNFNSGTGGNHNNWVLPVYNSASENKIVVRSDFWEDNDKGEGHEWGSNKGCAATIVWDNFVSNMNGAIVDMTVSFTSDKKFTMSSIISPSDGSDDWTYSYTSDYDDSPYNFTSDDYLEVAISVSNSWLWLMEEGPVAKIGATGWTTFASAYPLDLGGMSASEGTVKAYYASSQSGSNIVMTPTESEGVAAGEGLMLKGTAGATVTIPVVASGDAISGNMLVGCPNGETLTANANYYVLIKNGETAEFQSLKNSGATIPAGKAYLNTGILSPARLIISFEEDPTAINAVEAAEAESGALKDGKYIIDNKVVIVKNGVKYSANGQILK